MHVTHTKAVLLLMLLACSAIAPAQPLAWVQGLETAQELSRRTNKPLLLFFNARNSAYANRVNEWLESDELHVIASSMVLVRFDLDDNQRFANSLGVYRAGTIMLYRTNGDALAQVADIVDADELKSKLSSALGSAGSAGTSVAAATPQIAPTVVAMREYLELPKGRQVGQAVIQYTSNSQPIRFGPLDNGKKYVLQLKGVFTTRRAAQNGSDPLYNFFLPETPGKTSKSTFVRFPEGNLKLSSHFTKMNQPYPPYTLAHTYDVPIAGEGKELVLQFHESSERNYTDNEGTITLTLFEAR
jgi:hypothetical protein